MVEVCTRCWFAHVLLKHSRNVLHAKAHLERAQVLLKAIPGNILLKCTALSLLATCYHLIGHAHFHKHVLQKGIDLVTHQLATLPRSASGSEPGPSSAAGLGLGSGGGLGGGSGGGSAAELARWMGVFSVGMAGRLLGEGDVEGAAGALAKGMAAVQTTGDRGMMLLLSASLLHIRISTVHHTPQQISTLLSECTSLWQQIPPRQQPDYRGLFVYVQLLAATWHLRMADYNQAKADVAAAEEALAGMSPPAANREAPAGSSPVAASAPRQLQQGGNVHAQRLGQDTGAVRAVGAAGAAGAAGGVMGNGAGAMVAGEGGEASGACFRDDPLMRLPLGPPHVLNADWLPLPAVRAVAGLLKVMLSRPGGKLLEAEGALKEEREMLRDELHRIGVLPGSTESTLEPWSVAWAGTLLLLLYAVVHSGALECGVGRHALALASLRLGSPSSAGADIYRIPPLATGGAGGADIYRVSSLSMGKLRMQAYAQAVLALTSNEYSLLQRAASSSRTTSTTAPSTAWLSACNHFLSPYPPVYCPTLLPSPHALPSRPGPPPPTISTIGPSAALLSASLPSQWTCHRLWSKKKHRAPKRGSRSSKKHTTPLESTLLSLAIIGAASYYSCPSAFLQAVDILSALEQEEAQHAQTRQQQQQQAGALPSPSAASPSAAGVATGEERKREQCAQLLATALLALRQGNLVDARSRLAQGLLVTHRQLSNHQIAAHFLLAIGGIALRTSDLVGAKDILRSGLTLFRAARDTQGVVAVAAELSLLYRSTDEAMAESQNAAYLNRKRGELSQQVTAVVGAPGHAILLQYGPPL
ncbi:unnamed protein product [Closterium sp. NIES-64]|nr:unnamed protein product [Closterium sp. NIES-64]